MQADPTVRKDGFVSLLGGVDSSKSAELIGSEQCAFSVNTIFRGGKPRTRARFHQLELTGAGLVALEEQLLLGGGVYFKSTEGDSEIFLAVGGRVLRIQINNFSGTVQDMNTTSRNFLTARTYVCQAENFLILQNGVDNAFIYDGTSLRRARSGSNNPALVVNSITVSGTTATIETAPDPHPFALNDYIDLGGADIGIFQGQHYVTGVPATNELTIEVASSAPTIGSGDLQIRYCPEIPTGSIMAYGQGRIFVASPERDDFVALDIVYGDEQGRVDNILRNTENTYLAEGGSFRLPAFMGRITGMAFVPFQDTTTGQGDLIVYGERGAASFDVSKPRSTWKATPIQRVLFDTFGATSQESIVGFNGDQFFRSTDGERSYRMARAESASYGQTPLSAEVDRVLTQDRQDWLDRVSGINFDRRLLFTADPIQTPFINSILFIEVVSVSEVRIRTRVPHNLLTGYLFEVEGSAYIDGIHTVTSIEDDTTFITSIPVLQPSEMNPTALLLYDPEGVSFDHKVIIALDFTPVAGNSGKGPAAYNGAWAGPDESFRLLLSGMFENEMRAYFVGRTPQDGNTIWEISRDFGGDIDNNDNLRPINCWLETRSFDFRAPFELKKISRADLWVSELSGNVDFKVYFRPDQYPAWVLWHEFNLTAPIVDTAVDHVTGLPVTGLPQYRTQVTLPTPADAGSPVDNRLYRVGFNFQIRIEWVGNCKIEKFMIYANEIPENLQNGGRV